MEHDVAQFSLLLNLLNESLDPRALSPLGNLLQNSSMEDVSRLVGNALCCWGVEAIPTLSNVLMGEGTEIGRYRAAQTLGKIGDPSALPILRECKKKEPDYSGFQKFKLGGEPGD